MSPHPSPPAGAQRLSSHTPALPAQYVRVPSRLLQQAAYDPLAVGVYALIARLFLVAHDDMPLSAADITRYDPSLSRGAADRALTRLTSGGWLLVTTSPGKKSRYRPAWGFIGGQVLPWRSDADCLGRPRHIRAIALDLRLLDVLMGKLMPHTARAAVVTRYLTRPALTLADVGAYALALGGLPAPAATLAAWGLMEDGRPRPLPATTTLLALASQRAFGTQPASLTPSGVRQIGPALLPRDGPSSEPLFFVPPELIAHLPGPVIGGVIAGGGPDESQLAASQSAKAGYESQPASITWDSQEQNEQKQVTPQTPHRRGGRTPILLCEEEPVTPAALLLRTLNIRPDVIRELAEIDAQVVQAAIADGRARPSVRDLAGWVVAMLRANRDYGWRIQPPLDGAQALGEHFARLAAEQAELAQRESQAASAKAKDELEASPIATPALEAMPTHAPDDLTDALLMALRPRLPRANWPMLARLRAERRAGAVWLRCTRPADAPAVRALLPQFEAALAELGRCGPLRLQLGNAPGEAANDDRGRPGWIAPEQWGELPAMVRAALRGSELQADGLHAASPQLQRLLETRYSAEVERLLASAAGGRSYERTNGVNSS